MPEGVSVLVASIIVVLPLPSLLIALFILRGRGCSFIGQPLFPWSWVSECDGCIRCRELPLEGLSVLMEEEEEDPETQALVQAFFMELGYPPTVTPR